MHMRLDARGRAGEYDIQPLRLGRSGLSIPSSVLYGNLQKAHVW
jgi:hypothetical protein